VREHFAGKAELELRRPALRVGAFLRQIREKRLFLLLFGGSTRFKQSCLAVAIPSNYKALNPKRFRLPYEYDPRDNSK
jgi:hypothetical protein